MKREDFFDDDFFKQFKTDDELSDFLKDIQNNEIEKSKKSPIRKGWGFFYKKTIINTEFYSKGFDVYFFIFLDLDRAVLDPAL